MKRGDTWLWVALAVFVLVIIATPVLFNADPSCTQVKVHAESGEINAEVCQ